MRRTAGLHANPARLDLRKNLMYLRTLHLPRDRSAIFALKPMNLKIVLAQINRCSDKLRHGRPPSLWRSGDHVLALDAVQVGPSTTSLRARQSNPESLRGKTLDCFAALAMTEHVDRAQPLLRRQYRSLDFAEADAV